MSDTADGTTPQFWGALSDVKQLEASSLLAASTLARLFGSGAASIAAWCALYARLDGESDRYQLWLSAFKRLEASNISPND